MLPIHPLQLQKKQKTTSATFQKPIRHLIYKLNGNTNFLENIKQKFKKTMSWKKFGSEVTTQPKNNNLDCMIHPTFRNSNILFVFSFKNCNDYSARNSFNKYYILLVKIKDFNASTDNKPLFDQPVKKKQEAYERLIEMSRNDDYDNGKLIRIFVSSNYYKLISTDLSRQENTNIH